MKPEALVKAQIKEFLDHIGAYYIMPVPTGMGPKLLDFYVCWRGRFIAIEAKAPGAKATPLQRHELEKIKNAGGIAFEADSVWTAAVELEPDIPDVLRLRWQGQNDRFQVRQSTLREAKTQVQKMRRAVVDRGGQV
jgi:hypothetical protein